MCYIFTNKYEHAFWIGFQQGLLESASFPYDSTISATFIKKFGSKSQIPEGPHSNKQAEMEVVPWNDFTMANP